MEPGESDLHSSDSKPILLSGNDADCENTEKNMVNGAGLSKRALRRLIKHKKWLELKPLRRAKKKEKLKKKKLEQKLLDIKQLGPTRKELKMKKMALSKCNVSVVLDFSFDQLMSHKDVCKCIKQLGFCYSINRRTENPLQFHVTGFSGVSRDEMQRHLGYTNWDVNFHDESYLNIFKKEDLIYLTSDSENVITTLEERKTYIIGGLVDHNSYKGHCLKIAEEQSISHGRLPIKEHLEMKTREVLSIVHVFEILVLVSSGLSWTDALLKVIPQRKGASVKGKEGIENKPTSKTKPMAEEQNATESMTPT